MIIKINFNAGGSTFIIFDKTMDEFHPNGWFDKASIGREDGQPIESRDLRKPTGGPVLILVPSKKMLISENSVKSCEIIDDNEAMEQIRISTAMTDFISKPHNSRENHQSKLVERFKVEEEEEKENLPDLPEDIKITLTEE